MMQALYRHHLDLAGMRPDNLFAGGIPKQFFQAAEQYYARRRLMSAAVSSMHQAGVKKIMAMKGAALAELYPSPALRRMSDADLVVESRALPVASRALARLGWRRLRHQKSLVFVDESGFHLDLHAPLSEEAEAIWAGSAPGLFRGAYAPKAGHHLWFLAHHALQHGGSRIWRDAADSLAILEKDQSAAEQAYEFSEDFSRPETAAALAALFRFLKKWSHPPVELPAGRSDWSTAAWDSSDSILAHFERLAVDLAPPVALDFLAPLLIRPWSAVASRLTACRRERPAGEGVWAERDPVLGDLPSGGVYREALRFRLLFQLIGSGRIWQYRDLIAQQGKLEAAPSLFGGTEPTGKEKP